jgi:hypothetical protein
MLGRWNIRRPAETDMLQVVYAAALLLIAFAAAPYHAQQSYQDFQRWQSQQLENTREEQLYHQRQMEQETPTAAERSAAIPAGSGKGRALARG